MKQLLFIFIALCSIVAQAQDSIPQPQDSVPMTKTVFAELLGWNNNVLGLGKNAKVEVDFGEESWGWAGNDGRDFLVDETGKEIKFNSMVDAMNFMGLHGWHFEASYVVTVANQNVIHWLMSKEIPFDGNARDGIHQKRDFKKKKKEKKKKEHDKYDDDLYY